MHELRRTLRLLIDPTTGVVAHDAATAVYWEFETACRGAPDATTGYLVDIKAIDKAITDAIPALVLAVRSTPKASHGALLPAFAQEAQQRLQSLAGVQLHRIAWHPTPHHTASLETHDMRSVSLRTRHDFAASHRLHVASLSDAENCRIFGKCNHPSGHGHNYVVEPEVTVQLTEDGTQPFGFTELAAAVERTILDRFDHKHLNLDTEEFKATNPSVEHIARVCYDLLAADLAHHRAPATLTRITVWETEKTCCVYAP